jgi:hypothetical protein
MRKEKSLTDGFSSPRRVRICVCSFLRSCSRIAEVTHRAESHSSQNSPSRQKWHLKPVLRGSVSRGKAQDMPWHRVCKLKSMPIIQLLIILIVIGVILYLVNTLIPMDARIKTIINVIVILCVCLWLLQVFGIFGSSFGNVPRFR